MSCHSLDRNGANLFRLYFQIQFEADLLAPKQGLGTDRHVRRLRSHGYNTASESGSCRAGADFDNPPPLGDADRSRYIKIKSLDEIDEPELRKWIENAGQVEDWT